MHFTHNTMTHKLIILLTYNFKILGQFTTYFIICNNFVIFEDSHIKLCNNFSLVSFCLREHIGENTVIMFVPGNGPALRTDSFLE